MSIYSDFEGSVFKGLCGGGVKKKVSRVASASGGVLSLDTLKQKMPGVMVSEVEGGFRVRVPRVASSRASELGNSIRRVIKASNPGIDLEFSEDLADYEGEPDLVNKSVNPLWLLKKVNGDTFLIKRVC